MFKNFFEKLLEMWLHGLLINGQNQALTHQGMCVDKRPEKNAASAANYIEHTERK